jgi:hypothetical protein
MSTAREPRVSDLERALKELAYAQLRTERSLEQLSDELIAFKDEMREFKGEMLAFKDEMREFKGEMLAFKDEMATFKDEMATFKDEMQRDRREMNRQWGDLANRLGTLVEDIAAPNIPGVLSRYFGVDEPDFLMVRARRKHPTDPSRRREFDVIAVTPSLLLVNETKSRPRRESILEFADSFGEVTEYFPEYADRTVVPVLSALHLDEELIDLLTDRGIYAMTMSDDSMELRNFEAVSAASPRL